MGACRIYQRDVGFFIVRPAGRTYSEVQVLYSPGKGKS
jgi:hypothetical protein